MNKWYGGTKTEMERLLADAQALTGVKYDIDNLADVYSAIHAIQEQLGITGTTAKEAEKTISGSAATTKAAWQNVLTAISGGGDLDRAIENLVDSISNLFENIVPVVEKSLQGIGRLIERVAPQLVQTVAKSLIKAIPSLLNAVYEMIIGLAKGIYQGIVELFSETTMQQVSSDIGEAATAQAALNKEIKETEKALDGALAGFDELNVLSKQEGIASDSFSITNAEAAILGTAAENAEKIEDSIKNTTIELSKWDEFKYGLMSKINVSAIENANNSMLKLTSSAKEYINTVKGSGLDVDFNQLIADLTNFQIAVNGATSTAIAGGLDFATGLKGGKGSSTWQGIGEIAQGGYQFTIALRDLLGLETEALKQMFLPITNELPNLFKGLTPLQSALIDSFEKTINPLKTYLNELAWSKEIVTDEDINIVDSQFKNLIETLTSNIDATQEMAVQNIMELVEKGLLTDAEAKDVIAKTKKLYEQQQKQAVNAQDKIGQILRKAKEENREITIQEQLDIQSILKESEANIIEITSEGVSSQIDVLNDLRKEEGKISSARLSQVIQYANREFEERSKSADELYNSTIQEANTLYYDLGLIDDERYQEIVQSAKDTRSAQLLEAQKSREELVQEAIGLAGDIAKTVDPNTGEIYSKWELLWNAMYNKVVSMANKISDFSKGIINGLVDALNWVIDKINFVTEPFSNAEWLFGTKLPDYTISKIPYLAQGAVIPPNREFLAVLGDQTHGTNVEAPLTTIKQALVEAMSDFGGNGNNQPIIIEIDGREVFRAVRNAESRYGSQTIIGGVANAY